MNRLTAACRRRALPLLLCCACILLGPASGLAAEFDRTVPAARGARLDVRLFAGEVEVRAWDRDVVRVRATHFATDQVTLRSSGGIVAVRTRSRAGSPHAIDLVIDAPSWMPMSIAGTYVDISASGSRAGISAETVRGDVRVRGGAGRLTLKSIEGEVVLEGAEGQVALTGVNNGIRVSGLVGDLVAETVNGDVRLENIVSRSVEVGTDGGDISWTGPVAAGGHYRFASHGGDIDLTLDPMAGASVSVRAFEGEFRCTFPANLPERRPGKRFRFVLGSGAAALDLETFRGTITLRPAGANPPEAR